MGSTKRRSVRRARAAAALGVIGLLALLGSSASGQTVRAGNLVVTVEGGFTPHKLPKADPASITLSARSTIATADGTHLPALDFLNLEFDKHTGVYTKGLAGLHPGPARKHRHRAGEASLPGRDDRQRPGRRRNRIPRTGPLLRQGADGDLQRAAEERQPGLHLPGLRPVPAPTTFVTTAEIGKAQRGLRDQRLHQGADDRRRPGLAQLRRTLDPQKMDRERARNRRCSTGPVRPGTSSCAAN